MSDWKVGDQVLVYGGVCEIVAICGQYAWVLSPPDTMYTASLSDLTRSSKPKRKVVDEERLEKARDALRDMDDQCADFDDEF